MPVDRAGELLRRCLLATAAIALACALTWPAAAAAETFVVNTAADEADATLGDEFCVTAGGKCSLRAALEEANFSAEAFDQIEFEEEPFDGDSSGTIVLGGGLPPITSPLGLRGRGCENQSGLFGPCVEIDGVAGAPGLAVAATKEVEIENLAVTGAKVGLAISDTPGLRLRSSWFGVRLDGSAAANGVGIELGPGADGARIGGEGPEAGNLVANSSGVGLDILGAGNVIVLGNDFGVSPSGTAPAPNGTNIAIASTIGSDASGNTIGTRVGPTALATPQCDGGCNLISGAVSKGVDLAGDGVDRLPALGTTIAGNQIGLDATGEASLPNAEAGVRVGPASHTVIGGARAGDANRISGGTIAVEAGAAPNLVVRGNLVGSRAIAGGTGDPPEDGLLIDSRGLTFSTQEAQVLENELGLDGGSGITQNGLGGSIAGNLVEGAATGIEVGEEGSENLIEANVVEATDVGVLLAGGFNTIVGNEVSGGQQAGVRIEGAGAFGVSGNVIGGDSAAAENTIEGSGGPAIEIENAEASLNTVARNHGGANAGPFIDLIAVGGEPEGPNQGIRPPTFATLAPGSATGFAEPDNLVRVFRKQTPAPGELASFLGETTADEDGNWTLSFPAALPVGTAVAATQTSEVGGTSELAISEIVAVAAGVDARPAPPAGATADTKPPRTQILLQPRRVTKRRSVKFAFTADEPRSRFQCSLDGAKFRSCNSPTRFRNLRPGPHVFRVRAIDLAGNVDPTPVKRRFKILG